MLNCLKRIAKPTREERLRGILSVLEEIGAVYEIRRGKSNQQLAENITVSLNSLRPRLLIGAHYDNVPNSIGANDNAAAVCILLELIHRFLGTELNIGVEIVFFDQEETPNKGSKLYAESIDPKTIVGYINLDMCGVGDTIVISSKGIKTSDVLSNVVKESKTTLEHPIRVVEYLPSGDDSSYDEVGIPNLSVCVLPIEEVDIIAKMAKYIHHGLKQTLEDFPIIPTIVETMHNGPRDTLDVVQENAMQIVRDWLADVVLES